MSLRTFWSRTTHGATTLWSSRGIYSHIARNLRRYLVSHRRERPYGATASTGDIKGLEGCRGPSGVVISGLVCVFVIGAIGSKKDVLAIIPSSSENSLSPVFHGDLTKNDARPMGGGKLVSDQPGLPPYEAALESGRYKEPDSGQSQDHRERSGRICPETFPPFFPVIGACAFFYLGGMFMYVRFGLFYIDGKDTLRGMFSGGVIAFFGFLGLLLTVLGNWWTGPVCWAMGWK